MTIADEWARRAAQESFARQEQERRKIEAWASAAVVAFAIACVVPVLFTLIGFGFSVWIVLLLWSASAERRGWFDL